MAPTAAPTYAQVEALVDFMRENKELARGSLRGVNGRVRSKQLWENLCNSLNSMGSCTKSVEQWQRVWADKKDLVTGFATRSLSTTSGGPSVAPTLSQIDLKILLIMAEEIEQPQADLSVPAFPMGPPVRKPAISPTQAATPAGPLAQEQTSTSAEALATAELPMQNQRTLHTHSARPRVRRHRATEAARSRILEVEEQRLLNARRQNEELNGIKVAIQELCALVRGHLTRNN